MAEVLRSADRPRSTNPLVRFLIIGILAATSGACAITQNAVQASPVPVSTMDQPEALAKKRRLRKKKKNRKKNKKHQNEVVPMPPSGLNGLLDEKRKEQWNPDDPCEIKDFDEPGACRIAKVTIRTRVSS